MALSKALDGFRPSRQKGSATNSQVLVNTLSLLVMQQTFLTVTL